MNAKPPAVVRAGSISAFLALGFRPFFLLAGLTAVLTMASWIGWLAIHGRGGTVTGSTTHFPALLWHGHEMVYGYVPAVIAGFFLTAMPNWTGLPAIRGRALAGLVALWLAGRAVVWAGGPLPPSVTAVVDCAFLPVVAGVVAVVLVRGRSTRNVPLVLVLLALAAGNVMVHLEVLGIADTGSLGLLLGVDATVVLMTVIGGRVIPTFTRNALQANGVPAPVRMRPRLDDAGNLAVIAVMAADVLAPYSAVTGWIAVVAAAINAGRLSGWQGHRTLLQPILWILHAGWLWIVVGLLLKGLAILTGSLSPSTAMHALTAGAIGTLTLGMMSRVALGHTGRSLVAPRPIAVAYGLVVSGALLRVAGPPLLSALYTWVMVISGAMWMLAFVIFVGVYTPLLLRPRLDGKPG